LDQEQELKALKAASAAAAAGGGNGIQGQQQGKIGSSAGRLSPGMHMSAADEDEEEQVAAEADDAPEGLEILGDEPGQLQGETQNIQGPDNGADANDVYSVL